MKTNIVHLPNQRVHDLTDAEWCVQILASEIQKAFNRGITIKDIVASTGISHATISRIYYRETKFPRMTTITGLFAYFGYRCTAQR